MVGDVCGGLFAGSTLIELIQMRSAVGPRRENSVVEFVLKFWIV